MNFKRLLSLIAIAVIGIINILIYCNSHFYYRAKEKIEDSEKKIKTLERANLFYPSNDLVFYELGKAYFDVGIRNLYDKERSHTFLQKSIQNFTRSLRINPASYFCHFDLAQSLLYISYLSPDFDANYYDEHKKAALLAGQNSQIYYEVGRILLSHWPALSEEDKDFTLEILREILKRKEREKLQAVMQIWEMNVKDYEVMVENLIGIRANETAKVSIALKPMIQEGTDVKKDKRCPRGDWYIPEVEGECDEGYVWNPEKKRCECKKRRGFAAFFATPLGIALIIAATSATVYGVVTLVTPAEESPFKK